MSLMQRSLSGAVLILVIAGLRGLFLNRLPKGLFPILWGIVLIRLLVPFSIPSVFSVYALANRSEAVYSAMAGSPAASLLPVSGSGGLRPEAGASAAGGFWQAVWLTGMVLLALFFAGSYLLCRRRLRTALPVSIPFAETWLADHKLRRRMTIRQSGRISSPLTYGVFRPVIVMPQNTDWENQRQLELVLTHEYIHIRRNDPVTKLFIIAALCVHWFNPMVWVMFILFNRDLELSCDACVVSRFGAASRASYATALIDMEEKRSQPALLCQFSKNAIEERVLAIMKGQRISPWRRGLSAALVLCVGLCFATSPASGAAAQGPSGWVWPTAGDISSDFGQRVHPVTGETILVDHITVAGTQGNDVLAAIGGTVTETGFDTEYGNYIVTTGGDGTVTLYGHLQDILAGAGDWVNAGDRIGTVGATGNAVGPCLSFAVFVGGEPVDPLDYYE